MSDRRNNLVLRLKELFGELTGQDLDNADSAASFFDLGFDSLLLTQVSQSVQSKFGVKVTFRQIMNDLASLDTLAGFLDERLPPEPAAAPTAPAAKALPAKTVELTAPIPSAAPAPPGPLSCEPGPMVGAQADSGPVERVVKQQLQVMAHQLELLRRVAPGASISSFPGVVESAKVAAAATTRQVARPVVKAIKAQGEDSKRFGPFKGIEKGPAGGLTPRQEKGLAELIARYNRRTAGSKKLTQEHRAHYCDPRAVGGFRQLWKEMVYPIVCSRSLGSRIWDIDGNEYVDVTMGFGANYLGHSPDFVMKAVEEQMSRGVEIGPQSPLAGENCKLICELTGMDRATFCNTGSEAVMIALRVARTVTALRLARWVYGWPRLFWWLLKRHPGIMNIYFKILQGQESYGSFFRELQKRVRRYTGLQRIIGEPRPNVPSYVLPSRWVFWLMLLALVTGFLFLMAHGYQGMQQIHQLAQKREGLIRDNQELKKQEK